MTGPAPRVAADRPRFLCDAMLGSLARWLRFFGYDTVFCGPELPDGDLARRAREDERWLLTRDRELAAAGPKTMLVRADGLEGQLEEVFVRLGLDPTPELEGARCAECNGELQPVASDEVADVVPPYVLGTASRFNRCRRCGRVYWPGSHSRRILETMGRVVRRVAARRVKGAPEDGGETGKMTS